MASEPEIPFDVDLSPASPGPAWEWPDEPTYPQVEVQLSTGQDGNIWMVLGAVRVAMRRAGVPDAEIEQFSIELMSTGSYDQALQLIMKTVRVT